MYFELPKSRVNDFKKAANIVCFCGVSNGIAFGFV